MSSPIKVAIAGATGHNGTSIVNGLLASETRFEITALSRESSINSDANKSLQQRGVRVVAADLKGPKQALADVLTGIDVVISCVPFSALQDQIPFAEAAKEAGVKRFVPCNFANPAPRGVAWLIDQKYEIIDAIRRTYLPYTVIDVAWWSEQIIPVLPSGKTDHALNKNDRGREIPGDGTVPVAFASLTDVGLYVAKIIADPRTLNRRVLAYTDVLTMNQVYDLMDELSGEKTVRKYVDAETLQKNIADANEALAKDPADGSALFAKIINQYYYSWGVRGDNQPESAKYLGYLDVKELYPDVSGRSMRRFFQDILDGETPNLRY